MLQTMQPQHQSHLKSRLSIVMTGLISLSLSGCCLFSPRQSDDHHASLVNEIGNADQLQIITTVNLKQQIAIDKLYSERHG
ncbi:MAG: hypothetical protein V3V22_06510 [Methylococcales bacterium]